MYSLTDYGKMLTEEARRQAYLDAIEMAIRPGCVVLEIGTGPGVFALCAARSRARRIYAIEPDDSIQVARDLAAANGLSERIEFLQGFSTELDLPEKADVIFSDLRGRLPVYHNHLPAVIDARHRLLAPGGTMIPREDSLWVCVVTADEIYRQRTRPWGGHWLGLDLSLPLDLVNNTVSGQLITPDQCLLEARRWAVLDYCTLDSVDVAGHANWEVSEAGLAHGLAVWFDTCLAAGVGFSNAPGQPGLVYRQTFFPFLRPVTLRSGDLVDVDLQAIKVKGDYVWRWTTSIRGASGENTRFEQSTFYGALLSPSNLRRQAASYVPELSDDGRMVSFVLARIDGRRSLEEIARELQAAFPARFEDWRDALRQVAAVAEDHG